MKSKLVKYPFKDGKRYRWDTYKMGKKFEYTWEQSEPNNFDTITPYIKAKPYSANTQKHLAQIDLANKDLISSTTLDKGDSVYKMRYKSMSDFARYAYGYGTCRCWGFVKSCAPITSNTGFTFRGTVASSHYDDYRNKYITIWPLEDSPVYYFFWRTQLQNSSNSYQYIRWGYYVNANRVDSVEQAAKDMIYLSIISPNLFISGCTPDSTAVALSLNDVDTIYNSMISGRGHRDSNNYRGTPSDISDWVWGTYHGPVNTDGYTNGVPMVYDSSYWGAQPAAGGYSFPEADLHFYDEYGGNAPFGEISCLIPLDEDIYDVQIAYRCLYSDIADDMPTSSPGDYTSLTNAQKENLTYGQIVNYGMFGGPLGLTIYQDGVSVEGAPTFRYIVDSPNFELTLLDTVPNTISSYKIVIDWSLSSNTFIHKLTNSELNGASSLILGNEEARRYEYIFNYWKPNNKWCAWFQNALQNDILAPNYTIDASGNVYKIGTLTFNGYNVYDAYTVIQNNYANTISKTLLASNNTTSDLNIAPTLWPCNCYLIVDDDGTFDASDRYLIYGSISTAPIPSNNWGVYYEDWDGEITDFKFINKAPTYLAYPDIKLIGDQTADTIIVPSGNTSILSYTIGEPTDKQHLNPKSLQINAPTEYGRIAYKPSSTNMPFYTSNDVSYTMDMVRAENGYVYIDIATESETEWAEHVTPTLTTVGTDKMFLPNVQYTIDDAYFNDFVNWYTHYCNDNYPIFETYGITQSTWLSFNSYTANEWDNGYHFQGYQWNNIGSPWAYTGNMLAQGEHKMTLIGHEPCEAGTYLNIFSITNQINTVVEDTLGNTFSTSVETYRNNTGDLYFFGDDVVKSNNRNAYPDHGYQGKYMYILKPEDTKFITYTNSTKTTLNVELSKDRYYLPHTNAYFNRDTSLYNTVIGTTTSTNESSIPDASWRKYLGIYLGESIPFLGITEHNIPDSEILGVPIYDKQVNTSETLKYGTVASASVTFVINKPVEEAMLYNQEYLVLFYDYENNSDWKRLGFFYVDSIEAIDEYTSRLTAHDEAYKLNKYVDDFLAGYTQPDTLDGFYRDLLDYCGCAYDAHNPSINTSIGNRQLDNVYYAVKTTGTEVAHYIATLVPGFVHADIDGDMVLQQYKNTATTIDKTQYTDLKYVAYKADTVNKVRITLNNVVIGESSDAGENVYYISDNPLINSGWRKADIDALAQQIKLHYTVRDYRPAEMSFLTMPNILIGDNFYVVTPKNETYCVFVMAMSVDASGVNIKSMGTQQFPVEAQSNSQFINLINNVDSVEVDVTNLELAQNTLAQRTTQNEDDIDDIQEDISGLNDDITSLRTRLTNDEANINSLDTRLSNKINNDSISESNNLVSIKINGTTKNSITNKTYVDNTISSAISNSEAKNSISSANDLVTAMINNNTITDIATKAYVDAQIGGGGGGAKIARVHLLTPASMNFWYIGEDWNNTSLYKGLLIPAFYNTYSPTTYSNYCLFTVYDNQLYGLNLSTSQYDRISVSTGITVYSGWI